MLPPVPGTKKDKTMKKPWVIGLLSIIPGLGFFVLGKIREGFIASIITVGLIILSFLTSDSENFSATAFAIAIVAWGSQLVFAILLTPNETRSEMGLVLPKREVFIAPPSKDASLEEKHQYNIRKTVLGLLQPDENLKIVLSGQTGTVPLLQALIFSLLWSPPAVTLVYLGITEKHLIFINTDQLGKPSELQRLPFNQVVLANSREGVLSDRINIQVGDTKPLSIDVPRSSREATRQFIRYLTGTPYDNRISSTRVHKPGPFTSLRHNLNTKHPILASGLLGASGGIVGTIIAALALFILSMSIVITNETDSGEGWGYLIGLYCLLMFPVGGALLGGIPGVIVGAYHKIQGDDTTRLQPVLTGLLCVVVLTLGAFLAIYLIP